MTDSPEILDDDPPPPKVKKSRKAKSDEDKGVGVGLVIVASAIATVLGVTGGAILGNTLAEPATVEAEVSQADLEAMKTALNGLKSRTKKLESQQSDILDRQEILETEGTEPAVSGDETADLAKLLPLFDDIEGRLNALESGAPKPETTLPDSDAAEGEGRRPDINIPSAGNSKEISALSESVSDIESRLSDQSRRYVSKADLLALKKRVNQLEANFDNIPVSIPSFPRESVMDALTGKTKESGSWMSGLLGDEVRVVDAEMVRRLDHIEKLVETGDVKAIKTEVGYLPTEARPVIDGWLAQFEQSE